MPKTTTSDRAFDVKTQKVAGSIPAVYKPCKFSSVKLVAFPFCRPKLFDANAAGITVVREEKSIPAKLVAAENFLWIVA